MIEVLASLSLFGSGTYLGYRLAMHEVANRKPAAPAEPTTEFVLETGTDGTLRFKGSITSSDFLEAMNEMTQMERDFVTKVPHQGMSRDASTVYFMRGLYHLYRKLAIIRGA